ncbi:MAG: LysM peptidoglycan-binding domain-containing protein [Rhizonema sp. PD38]|nr:LysM peptidoglycan-binding domain-containing protein [Rhizonema sp. PD38]
MSTQLELKATFYSREETLGHPPATGIFGSTLLEALSGKGRLQCAVDPNVIALKTNFTLILWDGKQVQAAALDKGTAILGNKIDIFVDTISEAINLGVKSVKAVLDSGVVHPPSSQTYTVQAGDTLSSIAQKFYGDGSEQSWRKIYDANKAVIGPDPNQLKVRMILTIP